MSKMTAKNMTPPPSFGRRKNAAAIVEAPSSGALTGRPDRKFAGLHPPSGGATSPPLSINGRFFLPILALLAILAVSLLFLLPGGSVLAQDDNGAIEYAENGTGPVATYTAVDPEGADITSWTLGGDDADDFMIDGGVLSFAKSPDYEMATDADTDNTYKVTVQATDESNKVGMHEVTVEVTNVDEDGTVTLSALRPQSQTMFNATHTDPDGPDTGDITDLKWQWAKSSSKNGSYTDIDKAIASSYTPQDADVGSYLRVTATYTDPEDSGKSAMATSAYKVQGVRGSNNAPVFPDQDAEDPGDQSTTAMRTVAENTASGQAIGDPLAAEDEDGDILTYTLSGADADSFSIDWATGQLMTKGELDHETGGGTRTVTVRATDPAGVPQAQTAVEDNSDEITVNITVTDVGEPPAVSGEAEATFAELAGAIATPLDTYTGTDPDDGAPTPTWSVAGDDGSKFDISNNGALTFKAKPDFEAPTDANKDNVYEVTVRAADGDGNRDEMAVKVTVENENEDGTVSLSRTQIRVGVAVTASLSDPDGSISGLTWQWTDGSNDIEDANSATYMPVADDVGDTLTAVASYTDGHGSGKMAEEAASSAVAVDTRNREPVFEDQDAETDGVQNESTTRTVAENTEAVAADDAATATDDTEDNVGSVVTATDPDPNTEALIYTLGGADAGSFRVRDNGQIEVGSGTELDYETQQTYEVTVNAEDSFGASASIMVTIMVTDVDEAPDVTGDDMAEYAENGTASVATYTAVDPEGADITSWTLGGDDADDFMIDGGVLSFAKSPDYEMATDADTDNTYKVTVQATDESNKVGMHEVTVEVTNVDEDGTVTLSALRPQSQTMFNATHTDPDGPDTGDITDLKWQWAKSSSKNGSYTDIDKAIASSYTPQDADVGSYLRVTATYTDPEDSGKSAMATSAYKVQGVRGSNNAPVFPDQDAEDPGDQSTTAMRTVAENTASGQAIGDPLAAEDEDGDILTYTLSGADADSFSIDWATGQLMTKGELDFEDETSHTVTVRATDPAGVPQAQTAEDTNSDEITVTINVTNVNEPPAVTGEAVTTFEEEAGAIATALDDYTADDPETGGANNDNDVTWSLSSADSSKFEISDAGGLTFKAKPDFEAPTDANMDNVYEVTVRAADDDGNRGEMAVKVTVMNEEEAGTVSLSRTQIRVGVAVTASLSDPDGSISGLTWQWTDGSNDIEDANSATYMPVADDVGDTLTAVASYTDGEGSDKTAMEEASSAVAVDTRNRAPVFEDQDAETDGVQNESTTRTVAENTEAVAADDAIDTDDTADNVGGVVTATDPDPNTEALIYTLGGADADKFRVRNNGQIEVGAGTELDYEIKTTYMVTVMAEDSFGASASIMVTIMVTDVDEAPEITAGGLAISGQSSVSYAENGTDAVETYSAAGPDAASATWSLSGADMGDFAIGSGGEVTFGTSPDYESPADMGGDNVYMVTVKADDGTYMDTHDVTVTVTNVDEPGTVTLSSMAPRVGTAITASVTDLDGGVTDTTWQWASSSDGATGWADISTSDSYTPVAGDENMYLRATASYTDPQGPDKSAEAVSATAVVAATARDPLLTEYDPNNDGSIDKADMRRAVANFFGTSPTLTTADMRRLVAIYFSQ